VREYMEFFSGMLSLLHSSLSTVLKASFGVSGRKAQ
jgi:hypothetical protein